MLLDSPFSMDQDSDSDVSMSEDSSEDEVMSGDSPMEDDDSEEEQQEARAEGEEEEDELVKAITASKEFHREHPPDIVIDDQDPSIHNICFHPEQDFIALACTNGDIKVYKYSNDENISQSVIEAHEDSCRDVKFSANGDTLFSVSKDKSIAITDFATQKFKGIYEEAHDSPIHVLSVISENTFATGDDDGTIKLWDLRQSGRLPIFSVKGEGSSVNAMLTNDEKKYLVCAIGDGTIMTINMPAKKVYCRTSEDAEYDESSCMGLFKHNSKILTATNSGKFYVFDWDKFAEPTDVFRYVNKKAIACMIPITDNIVITGDEDGVLRAFSVFPHEKLGIAGQHGNSVDALDISRDGSLIASSSDDSVKFWNVKYFETFDITKVQTQRNKGKKVKQAKFNLPSSKFENPSDFFDGFKNDA
ncbi:hypothetical protein G9C98_006261 [Cotesia typhae]|uniref:WD repeat-containing protein 55 homolog n=1 Tax=Cotesia typhae TaxID=2053667 RepID=A0A8J5UV37_9HYME|nr:hypothetical protein G9C98_006261 [Cotesia typhae]